nr:MAG TPA: hypothetical protein [Caudoviricetes sp.]
MMPNTLKGANEKLCAFRLFELIIFFACTD